MPPANEITSGRATTLSSSRMAEACIRCVRRAKCFDQSVVMFTSYRPGLANELNAIPVLAKLSCSKFRRIGGGFPRTQHKRCSVKGEIELQCLFTGQTEFSYDATDATNLELN